MVDYPFQFSRDSLLGKLIAEVWNQIGNDASALEDAFLSNLADGEAFFSTPNVERQVLMNLLPAQFRKHMERAEYIIIGEKIQDLMKGNSHISPVPRADVAFELVEWILTGYENDDLVLDLVRILFNKKIIFPENFLEKLRAQYVHMLNET